MRQIREELGLQAHLFGLEAKEEWRVLESKFRQAKRNFDSAVGDGGRVSKEVEHALRSLTDRYEAFRKKLMKRRELGAETSAEEY